MNMNSYEINYVNSLNYLQEEGHNKSSIRSNPALYNKIATNAYEFYAHIVLTTSRNRALISLCDIPFTSFADEATLAFLNKIDKVMACESDEHILKLCTIIGNHVVIDIVRRYYRTNPVINRAGSIVNYSSDYDNSQRMLCHLEDDIWNLMPNKAVDIENDYIQSEDTLENRAIVEQLFSCMYKLSAFQATCFLYTKVLTNSANEPLRPRDLARIITEYGLQTVAKATFSAVCELFFVPYYDYFTYKDYSVPHYGDERSLADIISKNTYVATGKLRNYYLKDMNKVNKIKTGEMEKKLKEKSKKIVKFRIPERSNI